MFDVVIVNAPLRFLVAGLVYMRLPGHETTVNATLFLCSFSMGTSAEWLIPTVESPFTATIISPHLKHSADHTAVNTELLIQISI